MESIDNDVFDILHAQGIAPAQISRQSHLSRDLGYDSLDATELVILLERRFDLAIPDQDYDRLGTVGDIADYLAERLTKRPAPLPLSDFTL